MTPGKVLAIDIGGTKMAAALVDGDGNVEGRQQIPTPRDVDAEELYARLRDLSARVLSSEKAEACGIGCGGPMSRGE